MDLPDTCTGAAASAGVRRIFAEPLEMIRENPLHPRNPRSLFPS
jgi:hypothetical protein